VDTRVMPAGECDPGAEDRGPDGPGGDPGAGPGPTFPRVHGPWATVSSEVTLYFPAAIAHIVHVGRSRRRG
jgi:hypothetical protein